MNDTDWAAAGARVTITYLNGGTAPDIITAITAGQIVTQFNGKFSRTKLTSLTKPNVTISPRTGQERTMPRTAPVIVKLLCEAERSEDTLKIDRTEWNSMTPAERAESLDRAVSEHINNAGGGGWHIADPDDESEVGLPRVQYPVDLDQVMTLVARYGAACHTGGPLSGDAVELLDRVRAAIEGK